MAVASKSRTNDRYNLEARLEKLIDSHLQDIEEHPEMYASKDRLAAIQYIGMFLNRKYGWGEPEQEGVGSSVRKYARAAFQTPPYAVGGRTTSARSTSKQLASVPADTQSDNDGEDAAA